MEAQEKNADSHWNSDCKLEAIEMVAQLALKLALDSKDIKQEAIFALQFIANMARSAPPAQTYH